MNLLVVLMTVGQLTVAQAGPSPAPIATAATGLSALALTGAEDKAAKPKPITEREIEELSAETEYGEGMWFPPQASNFAETSDNLYFFILLLCVLSFVLLMFLTVFWSFKYRRKSPTQRTSPIKHSFKLEFLWSAIPTILLVLVFAWGQRDFIEMTTPPNGSLDVRATAQKWNWTFAYPSLNKVCSPDKYSRSRLVVPLDKPVKLTISSVDVVHSLWIPAFRLKKDAVPNRYTGFWFTATEEGVYDLFCAEFCGQDHSIMKGKVHVYEERDWADFVEGSDCAAVDDSDGKGLFKLKGCIGCHTTDGTKNTGPTMFGNYGTTVTHNDGTQAVVDDNYIQESLMKPNAKIVKGYGDVMPVFAGQLNLKQVTSIIDYMKTLK